ncbi:MAG TPA: hypothetical protein VLH79_00050, partial [Chthonomonadales bacterium]|nr:hypothetical protein [Chthonomonadales bacterium]
MRVLVSPVGMQDPHGKKDPGTGDLTEGSALQIARVVRPDRVLLMPTDGTIAHADATGDAMREQGICAEVEVRPIAMDQPQDYEEAIRAYGTALREACSTPGDEYFLNTSSGTPAIKSACMMAVAEGAVRGEAWYADDPTMTTRDDAVRRLDVSFLRVSALRQRTGDLLGQGQFWAAKEACAELKAALPDGPDKAWAGAWKQWLKALQAWDEREYEAAQDRINEAWRNRQALASEGAAALLRACLDALERREARGWMAWDAYHLAGRLVRQTRYAIAAVWAWVAVETSVKGRLTKDGDLVDQLKRLDDDGARKFFRRTIGGGSAEKEMRRLRSRRNDCVHKGARVDKAAAERMLALAEAWLGDVVGEDGASSPIAPSELARLAA